MRLGECGESRRSAKQHADLAVASAGLGQIKLSEPFLAQRPARSTPRDKCNKEQHVPPHQKGASCGKGIAIIAPRGVRTPMARPTHQEGWRRPVGCTHRDPYVQQHRWHGEPQRNASANWGGRFSGGSSATDPTPHTTIKRVALSQALPRARCGPPSPAVPVRQRREYEPMLHPPEWQSRSVLLLRARCRGRQGVQREEPAEDRKRARRRAGVHRHGVQPPAVT